MFEFLKEPYFQGFAALCGIIGFGIQIYRVIKNRNVSHSTQHEMNNTDFFGGPQKTILPKKRKGFKSFWMIPFVYVLANLLIIIFIYISYLLAALLSNLIIAHQLPHKKIISDTIEILNNYLIAFAPPIGLPSYYIAWLVYSLESKGSKPGIVFNVGAVLVLPWSYYLAKNDYLLEHTTMLGKVHFYPGDFWGQFFLFICISGLFILSYFPFFDFNRFKRIMRS